MASDIYELARRLGYDKVNIAGHDIGSMVAFSFAANHPEATLKLALLDVPHPDDFFTQMRCSLSTASSATRSPTSSQATRGGSPFIK